MSSTNSFHDDTSGARHEGADSLAKPLRTSSPTASNNETSYTDLLGDHAHVDWSGAELRAHRLGTTSATFSEDVNEEMFHSMEPRSLAGSRTNPLIIDEEVEQVVGPDGAVGVDSSHERPGQVSMQTMQRLAQGSSTFSGYSHRDHIVALENTAAPRASSAPPFNRLAHNYPGQPTCASTGMNGGSTTSLPEYELSPEEISRIDALIYSAPELPGPPIFTEPEEIRSARSHHRHNSIAVPGPSSFKNQRSREWPHRVGPNASPKGSLSEDAEDMDRKRRRGLNGDVLDDDGTARSNNGGASEGLHNQDPYQYNQRPHPKHGW